jgi:hypothetical protein
MAMTFTITAILASVIGSGSSAALENGIEARELADSGAENALLRLVRDPEYVGEQYLVGGGTIDISISGTSPKIITSQASLRGYVRTVEVITSYNNNVLDVTSWKEVY